MNVDFGYTVQLKLAYRAINLVVLANVLLHMIYGLIAGSVLWEERVSRVNTWMFWWFWGQTFGFAAPTATLFLLSHTWYGVYYWFHLAVCVPCVAWHVVFGIMLIKVFTKCTALCDGITLPGAVYGTDPDWALWGYVGCVGGMVVCDLIYVFFNFYLHRKTEFRMQLELAAASRAPAVSRTYMGMATGGGSRWIYDMFSPPGLNSTAYNPYNASLNYMQPNARRAISAEIDEHIAAAAYTQVIGKENNTVLCPQTSVSLTTDRKTEFRMQRELAACGNVSRSCNAVVLGD